MATLWLTLLVVPSVVTVLRFTTARLNADGIEQSVMSVQGPSLFYWGQDRLLPAVSILASPVSDPAANLWVCLVLQAMSFFGLLLLVAHRCAATIATVTTFTVAACYLILVAVAVAVLGEAAMHVFALEGQPYALSWLMTGLAYEAWKRGGVTGVAGASLFGFIALGLNPSAVLLGAFLAVTAALRHRRVLRWVAFLAVLAGCFVVWSFLASRFGMYPTPVKTPAPSYLGFSLAQFQLGLPISLANIVSQFQPARTVVALLASLACMIALSPRTRSTLLVHAAFLGGFTVLYVSLFAGNEWVGLNGYHFRYFFPLSLALVMGMAVPIFAAFVQLVAWTTQEHGDRRRLVEYTGLVAASLCLAAAIAGPLRAPGDSIVLQAEAPLQKFAVARDVRFLSGSYWDMWPLMHELQSRGRDGVFVAGLKSGGDRTEYRRALQDELDKTGTARAMCVNAAVNTCQAYLAYWTRPGWTTAGGPSFCPTPLRFGLANEPLIPTCRVLRLTSS